MKHLHPEQLFAVADGDPAPAHLARCRRCLEELETTRTILAAARGDRTPEPSPAALARVYRLLDAQPPLATTARRLIAWVGRLVLDSGTLAPAAAGARSAAPTTRQLLFQSERLDIDLAHPLEPGPVSLRGQAFLPAGGGPEPVAWRPVTLTARGHGRPPTTTSTDALGSFRFPAVAAGGYELRIELDEGDVIVSFDL